MANETVWHKVNRVHRSPNFRPIITIRQNGTLAVSADFVRMAGIGNCTRVSLFLSSDGMKLGMDFHSNETDDDAFLLSQDGGGGGKGPRLVTAASLLHQSLVLKALVKESSQVRRLTPKKDGTKWVLNIAPCFEQQCDRENCQVGPTETGIYRYRSSGLVVYIGRGCIRSRISEQQRNSWVFDTIEYSIINNEELERSWESFWLNEYRRVHRVWPQYNKIGGIAVGS